MDARRFAMVLREMRWDDGGFTVDPAGGRYVPADGDYAVSLAGHERVFDRCPDPVEVLDFMLINMADLQQVGRYIGGWVSGGRFFLDVSVVVRGIEKALALAALHGQAAVWDFGAQSEVRVSLAGRHQPHLVATT